MENKRAHEILGMAVTFNGCGRCTSDELEEAIKVAKKALYATEWISVSDRLPNPYETVIVQMPLEAPLPTVGWGFIKGDGEWHCNYFNREKDEVTHWMPLPPAPKEDA